ncbi:DUF4355 domain-containing protein [Erysipelothrix sp. HDW6A]|uniref:DUF4355 domain-containing protein n=1 Tax=Erysipelothrix sp. HDW6A TaxID=2714928 RepID=UPI00140E2699|nr:DUF4355 domain-containing protein [Erysipelothrix sp. HDW6A]QIK57774.1 DUF4355 domain-containing protein [Erysipelothrix sp. HDW6A]
MKDLFKFPLNIQLFADEGSEGSEEGNEHSDETAKPKEDTFTQADIDRAVTKAVQTATTNLETKNKTVLQKAVDDALAEERRKASLTEEQRQEEARTQAQKAFEAKEAELNNKLLRVDVGQVLVEHELNPELLDFVLGKDVDESIKNIDKLVSVIDKQVEDRIKKVVTKPGVPNKPQGKLITKQEIMSIKDDEERQKQIALHPQLFKYGG